MKKDLYKIVDILIPITIIGILIVVYKKDSSKYFAIIPLIATVVIFLIQAIFGKTFCQNNSSKSIYAKPENDNYPKEIKPNNGLYDIDGIKVDNKIYKICDGTHIIINEDGTIKNTSFVGKIFNSIRGGYFEKAPAENWKKLEEI